MDTEKKIMLVVDDMELNRAILCELFNDSYDVIEAENGREALQLIQKYGESIAIVLLDLIMPVLNGFEVLQKMADSGLSDRVPVIMITSENSEQAILNGYNLGVSDVITKPFNPDIVRKRVQNTVELNSYKLQLENKVKTQVEFIERQSQELERVNSFIIDTLSTIVEFRDLESGQHVKRIRGLTKILLHGVARKHKEYGLTEESINTISSASAMHDIGKIAIPDHILLKPGRLTPEEFEIMKTHTTKGCDLLNSLNYIKTSNYFQYSYEICRYHHERWDGNGYPDHLKGDEIPIWAQVVALADVYDALTSERVYKPAYTHDQALKMILNGECGQFNPILMEVFQAVQDMIRKDEDIFSDLGSIGETPAKAIQGKEPMNLGAFAGKDRVVRLLEKEREKYKILAEFTGELVFCYDADSDYLELCGKSRDYLKLPEGVKNYHAYMIENNILFPEDQGKVGELQRQLKENPGGIEADLRIKCINDIYKQFHVQCRALGSDESGEHMEYIGKLMLTGEE